MSIQDNIIDQLRQRIQSNMHDKFGLSSDQVDQTSKLFSSHLKNLTSAQFFKENKDQILALLPDLSSLKSSKLFENFSGNFSKDLVNKLGLPQDTAERIKDFSMNELMNTIKEEMKDVEDKLDISNILKKVGLDKFESDAKEIVGNFSKLFNK